MRASLRITSAVDLNTRQQYGLLTVYLVADDNERGEGYREDWKIRPVRIDGLEVHATDDTPGKYPGRHWIVDGVPEEYAHPSIDERVQLLMTFASQAFGFRTIGEAHEEWPEGEPFCDYDYRRGNVIEFPTWQAEMQEWVVSKETHKRRWAELKLIVYVDLDDIPFPPVLFWPPGHSSNYTLTSGLPIDMRFADEHTRRKIEAGIEDARNHLEFYSRMMHLYQHERG